MNNSDFNSDRLPLSDVLKFITQIDRVQRKQHKKKARSHITKEAVVNLRSVVFRWVARILDEIVRFRYFSASAVAGVNSSPPAIRMPESPEKLRRPRTMVSGEAAWQVIEKARKTGVNVESVTEILEENDELGCHSTNGLNWLSLCVSLYYLNQQALWRAVRCLCLVADPGCHSYKDVLATVAYSFELDAGCMPPWQELVGGKIVFSHETELLNDLVELINAKKAERVAAFCQLQGVSHQIAQITDHRMTIDSFRLPATCCVRPVEAQEKRQYEVTPCGKRRAFLVRAHRSGHRKMEVLPSDVETLPLLVLMLDQGGVGAAGVAFAANFLKGLMFGKFDKIHRLIRDIKLAEKHAGKRYSFFKTKLWSAYIFCCNNRPFKSGKYLGQDTNDGGISGSARSPFGCVYKACSGPWSSMGHAMRHRRRTKNDFRRVGEHEDLETKRFPAKSGKLVCVELGCRQQYVGLGRQQGGS